MDTTHISPNASQEGAERARNIQGQVEHISADGIRGWCLDLDSPDEPLALEFRAAAQVLGFTSCTLPRPDLALADGAVPHCGFHWPLPRHLPHGGLNRLEAYLFQTAIRLPRAADALLTVEPARAAAPAATSPFQASERADLIVLDQADASGFSGWLKCADPAMALSVELYVDGEAQTSVAANLHRIDVQEAGIDPGTHGFHLGAPDCLFDGRPHQLVLRVPELEAQLVVPADPSLRFQRHESGGYHLRNGILYGWIDAGGLPGRVAELRIDDGNRNLAALPIDANDAPPGANTVASFKYELPLMLSDGQPHRLSVNLRGTRRRLQAQGGAASLDMCRPVRGRAELFDDNGITGWVYDARAPAEQQMVGLYDGDQLLGEAMTTTLRPDVNKLFQVSGEHGFHLFFPAHLYDGQPRNITLRVNGVPLNLSAEQDVPLRLQPAQLSGLNPSSRYQGVVDIANSGMVAGWAWDRKRPAHPVSVAVYVDNELIEVVQANRFNARLRTSIRRGHHVFLVRLPTRLMNGAKRAIKVVIVEGDLELRHEYTSLMFPLVDHFGSEIKMLPGGNYQHVPPAHLWRGSGQAPLPLPKTGAEPLLSIIVLNWNGAAILRDYLESMLRVQWRHSYELLLIDHGSIDDSLAVAAEYEQRLPLRILARGVNFSFSVSNNYAAGLARGRYLVFANNDLVMLHDCLAPMLARLADPAVGAVGLKLLEPLSTGPDSWRYITHHQGVRFKTDLIGPKGQRYYVPMEIGELPTADLAGCYDLPIATGALLMCRAEDFKAVGGFDEGYVYGMEDVDLCLTIGAQLGKAVLTETAAVALHNRSATRDSKILAGTQQKMYSAKLHQNNRKRYIERHGRDLTRTILSSLVEGDSKWRPTPLRVTIAVTETAISTAAGDLFTALEFGEALHRLYGWEVMFNEMAVHTLPGTDVLVVMRHDFSVQKISEANPGLVTVAWIRNRVDQWIKAPHFQAYQLVFASSQKALDEVKAATGVDGTLLPIAANAGRFRPQPAAPEHVSDVTFTGSFWGAEREAIGLQDITRADYRFAIYGHGWQDRPEWRDHWRGAVPYRALPQIYCSSKLVLDDSHPVTRVWNSLNSRVFDALACGKLVLTNCSGGAAEVFDNLLPSFDSDAELQALIRHYLEHDAEREALAARLREEVLAKHTYDQRAATFRDRLRLLLKRTLRFSIKIGVPDMAQRHQWGDYHFALGIQRALRARGHYARIDILPDWYGGLTAGDDVVLVLRGLSEYQPQPNTLNLAWLISHPDEVAVTELQRYHHVFVASEPFADWLGQRMGDQVSPLLQCTDPALFYPERDDALEVPEVIFVGNSRLQMREVVQYAVAGGIDFSVYGAQWEGLLPPSRVAGAYIDNASLRHYYSAARVVLNDHWTDMRSQGFISNRIFDAGACGAAIVSDDMAACRTLFGDAVQYYTTPENLASAVATLRRGKAKSNKESKQLRELIVSKHTFQHRVDAILDVVARLSPIAVKGRA